MDLSSLKRLPNRIGQDLRVVGLTKNWTELLLAKLGQKPFRNIHFRNGIFIEAPPEVSLDFLFNEIWLEEFYSGPGYEIKDSEIVVDIGGNIGVFAFWAATRAENVQVYSFEPFPKNAEYFVSNQTRSGLTNINFEQVAVGDSTEKRFLELTESWMLHHLATKDSGEGGLEVQCVSFDSILAKIPKCHFLKLDCEGGEYEILYGSSEESLSKIGCIVCEFNILDAQTRNGEALAEFLKNKGFAIDDMNLLDEGCGVIRAKRS